MGRIGQGKGLIGLIIGLFIGLFGGFEQKCLGISRMEMS
jgi:hypothetical protein